MIYIKTINFEAVQRGFEETPKLFERAFKRGFDVAGVKQVAYIRDRMMNDPKSGKIYTKYRGVGGRVLKKPTKYQASAPGEFPSVVSKELYKSVFYEVRGANQLAIGMGSPKAPYAKIIEEGGKNGKGHYIAPREPLKQTVKVFSPIVRDEINKQIKRALAKKGAQLQ